MHQMCDRFGNDAALRCRIELALGDEANDWLSGGEVVNSGDQGRTAGTCCCGIVSSQYDQQHQQQQRAERQRHP